MHGPDPETAPDSDPGVAPDTDPDDVGEGIAGTGVAVIGLDGAVVDRRIGIDRNGRNPCSALVAPLRTPAPSIQPVATGVPGSASTSPVYAAEPASEAWCAEAIVRAASASVLATTAYPSAKRTAPLP